MKYFISYTIELPLREKYLYSEFFWSVLSRIRTECGKIRIRKIPRTIFTQCLLLVKKRSDQGTRNHQQIIFRKVWTIHTQNSDQRSIFEYDDEIEVKLPFFTDLSHYFGIYLMTFAITIFIHGEKVT